MLLDVGVSPRLEVGLQGCAVPGGGVAITAHRCGVRRLVVLEAVDHIAEVVSLRTLRRGTVGQNVLDLPQGRGTAQGRGSGSSSTAPHGHRPIVGSAWFIGMPFVEILDGANGPLCLSVTAQGRRLIGCRRTRSVFRH